MSKENQIITRSAFVRSTTEEMLANRQVEFVISSEAVDTYKTVFRADGANMERYLKNPIVCYQHKAHSDDPDDIIGTSEVFRDGNQWVGRVTFEDAETNPKAEKVLQKVIAGTLRMASIGAIVDEASFGDFEKGENPEVLYFDRWTLLEWSIVTVGSNPDAHKRNAQTIEELRAELSAEENTVEPTTPEVKRNVREAQLVINKNRS